MTFRGLVLLCIGCRACALYPFRRAGPAAPALDATSTVNTRSVNRWSARVGDLRAHAPQEPAVIEHACTITFSSSGGGKRGRQRLGLSRSLGRCSLTRGAHPPSLCEVVLYHPCASPRVIPAFHPLIRPSPYSADTYGTEFSSSPASNLGVYTTFVCLQGGCPDHLQAAPSCCLHAGPLVSLVSLHARGSH
jgi:hypothetical protein